jgi:hypothetical protein
MRNEMDSGRGEGTCHDDDGEAKANVLMLIEDMDMDAR